MRVNDVMTVDVATTGPETLLKDAASEFVLRRISGMPVVDDDGRVLGIISETDILPKETGERKGGGWAQWLIAPSDPWVAARLDAVQVCDAMSTPAVTIAPDRPLAEAATLMLDRDVNRLPVVDADGMLVGLISRGDLVRAFARPDEQIRHDVEEEVLRKDLWLDPDTVQVAVTDGVVTLSGEVDSAVDAELIPTFTRKVPGVVEVQSSLTYRT
jgi:CBS domain-containing protein